jgi:hypothetical protein
MAVVIPLLARDKLTLHGTRLTNVKVSTLFMLLIASWRLEMFVERFLYLLSLSLSCCDQAAAELIVTANSD